MSESRWRVSLLTSLLDTEILVSPLPIWEEEWAHPEAYSNPRLLKNIQRDGLAL